MLGKIKLLTTLLVILVFPMPVYAVNSVSPHYSVNQILFGIGGAVNESSPNFKAQVTVGETGQGNYTSPNFQVNAGFNTNEAPYLEVVVTSTNLDLGVLSKSTAATAVATFYVRAWQATGYNVQADSPAPTNSGYTMHNLSTPTASIPGTEQFGMNLVANTSPVTVGANPSQTTAFAYGAAYTNYGTTNLYTYNNGDIIAQSTKSTSSTLYTITYLFNISQSTPGGAYVFNQNLVATGYY